MKEYILNKLGFYGIRTNWHSYPPISKLMCWMGRHDYEAVKVSNNAVVLQCFYCNHKKKSSLPI